MLHDVKNVLTKSVVSASNFPQSNIDAYNARTDELLGNLEQIILSPTGGGVRGNMEALDAFYKTKNLKLSTLSDAVRLAEQDLTLAKTGKDISGNASDTEVERAKTELNTSRYDVDIAEK